jgi:putative flippase GtrA
MARLNNPFETSETLRRISCFLLVGMLGTLIDITLFTALHVWLGVPTLLANTISYSAGIVNNFVLHRRWTFAEQPRRAMRVQFAQFAGISLGALMLNNLLVLLLAPSFGALLAHAGYGALLAKVCATVVGAGWNFLANNIWTFRNAPQEESPLAARSDRYFEKEYTGWKQPFQRK